MKEYRVVIIDKKHPWYGYSGILTGEIFNTVFGTEMATVKLDNNIKAGVTSKQIKLMQDDNYESI